MVNLKLSKKENNENSAADTAKIFNSNPIEFNPYKDYFISGSVKIEVSLILPREILLDFMPLF